MDITVIVTKVKFNDMEKKEFIERCHYVCNNWLVNELDKYIIGQKEAKKAVATKAMALKTAVRARTKTLFLSSIACLPAAGEVALAGVRLAFAFLVEGLARPLSSFLE